MNNQLTKVGGSRELSTDINAVSIGDNKRKGGKG